MRSLETYIGIEPFGVRVDDSEELRVLSAKARDLRTLPFSEKMNLLKNLAVGAMANAYERMNVDPNPEERRRYENIVFSKHSLGEALKQKAGCCRYQGTLFFVLGYEADLGDRHFLQSSEVNGRFHTVFNHVFDGDIRHLVSVFLDSLEDKSFDYSKTNPRIYTQPVDQTPGLEYFSYHRDKDRKLVLVSDISRHVMHL